MHIRGMQHTLNIFIWMHSHLYCMRADACVGETVAVLQRDAMCMPIVVACQDYGNPYFKCEFIEAKIMDKR